jgi:hypothetical protein
MELTICKLRKHGVELVSTTQVAGLEQKLKRFYQSIADGIVQLDDLLGEQIATLKADREKAKARWTGRKRKDRFDAENVEAFSAW